MKTALATTLFAATAVFLASGTPQDSVTLPAMEQDGRLYVKLDVTELPQGDNDYNIHRNGDLITFSRNDWPVVKLTADGPEIPDDDGPEDPRDPVPPPPKDEPATGAKALEITRKKFFRIGQMDLFKAHAKLLGDTFQQAAREDYSDLSDAQQKIRASIEPIIDGKEDPDHPPSPSDPDEEKVDIWTVFYTWIFRAGTLEALKGRLQEAAQLLRSA